MCSWIASSSIMSLINQDNIIVIGSHKLLHAFLAGHQSLRHDIKIRCKNIVIYGGMNKRIYPFTIDFATCSRLGFAFGERKHSLRSQLSMPLSSKASRRHNENSAYSTWQNKTSYSQCCLYGLAQTDFITHHIRIWITFYQTSGYNLLMRPRRHWGRIHTHIYTIRHFRCIL